MDTQDLNQAIQLDKIRTESFRFENHEAILNNWAQERAISFKEKEIPSIGALSFYEKEPIAAGFLRSCEGSVGLFDSFIANPFSEFEIRDVCLDQVVLYLLKEARERGLNQIFGFSKNKRILERAFKHGFIQMPHRVISLNL